MQTKTKLKGVKERNYIRQWLGGSILALAIFTFGFLIVPYLVAEASAETTSAAVTWSTISLTLDPHGDIDFGEVIPSYRDTAIGNYGTQKVVKKAVDVTTEGNYYAVYLSTASSDNSLTTDDDGTVQNIPAIASSVTNGFASTSWGYSVPTAQTSSILSAYDSFLASSNNVTANNLTKTGTGSSVYNTGSWTAVPTLANVTQIHSNSTEAISGFATGDSFNIYYSIMVDSDTISGVYENQVVYTAIANSGSLDEVSYNIARDKATVTSGTIETLRIDLAQNGNLITTNDIEVYLVPNSVFLANSYDIENLTTTDYPECTVSQITSQATSLIFTCTLPSFGATGPTDLNEDNKVALNSEYDFWVKVTLPTGDVANYVSHYKISGSDIASITYNSVGLQDVDIDGNRIVTSMQEMNGTICQNTNMWGSGTGDDAIIYDKNGEQLVEDIATGNALLEAGEDEEGISTFTLTDTRDSNTYKVRRLADGNCWMTENLLLDLTSIGTVSASDSDLTTDWTPDLTTISSAFDAYVTEPRFYSTNGQMINGVKIGNYYSWAAATADTYIIDGNGGSASESICPKNWQLPTGDTSPSKSYNSLIVSAYGISTYANTEKLPLSFLRAGYLDPYSTHRQYEFGSRGLYWSSTSGSLITRNNKLIAKARFFNMSTDNSQFSTVSEGFAADGFTIRCVARD